MIKIENLMNLVYSPVKTVSTAQEGIQVIFIFEVYQGILKKQMVTYYVCNIPTLNCQFTFIGVRLYELKPGDNMNKNNQVNDKIIAKTPFVFS